MDSLIDYPDAYADWRRRVRIYWWVGVGQILVTFAIVGTLATFDPLIGVLLFLASCILYVPLFLIAAESVATFRCPKCGNKYRPARGGFPTVTHSRCRSCRLSV